MSWFEALILGLIQGLTEFLPVSSSGHLELGKHFLQIESEQSLSFTVAVQWCNSVIYNSCFLEGDQGSVFRIYNF